MALAAYLKLFKLRICSLITFSAIVGLVAAGSATASGSLAWDKAAFLIISTMLASTAASAFNHYFDRDIDTLNARTKGRPLPSGGVFSSRAVLIISGALFILSIAVSAISLNRMVALHLFLGAFVYAVVYTAWLKRKSWMNIIIGGLAGSFAVLAGGASAEPGLCIPTLLLAVVMFFWTPSHFWSFAIFHREDYEKAGVPMLPVLIGDARTSYYILINTVILVASSLMPFFLGYNGWIYLATAVSSGAYFILWNVRLIRNPSKDVAWKNFKISMAYLGSLFAAVIIDMIFRGL